MAASNPLASGGSGRFSETTVGYFYTTACFLLWGLSPLFWKTLAVVPSTELVAYRVIWCGVLLVPLMFWRRSLGTFRRIFKSPKTLLLLLTSTVLIATNWFLYIWSVNSGHIVDASLGYFINPLVNVILGMVFLGERLRRWQWVSVVLAILGVTVLTVSLGSLPWISLALPITFGFYGLVRKLVAAPPEEGLALEVWILAPFVLAYLFTLDTPAILVADHTLHLLLAGTGLITALPLIWFTHGAKRLPLSTIGLLQYIAPTGQFLLGVFLYGEAFSRSHFVSFSFIWLALIVFTIDARRAALAEAQSKSMPGGVAASEQAVGNAS